VPWYLYDDARARGFEPFALTRPTAELRAGALLTRERWARVAGEPITGLVTAPHLDAFAEFDSPPVITDTIPAGAFIANSRCIPALIPRSGDVLMCGDRVAATRVRAPLEMRRLHGGELALEALVPDGAARVTVDGRWIENIWDYLAQLPTQLREDVPRFAAMLSCDEQGATQATRLGAHELFLERGAVVEPYTIFDLHDGPVLVRSGATVQAFTRVVGPCVIGRDSTVVADRIAASSIGDRCKVHGELSVSIVLGHSNKSHDGFVGHSYIGRWVNLGAGTITSNLKNTYGPVTLWTPVGSQDTGETFLGAFIGDYARTGIGVRLTTGCVVGAGANVFGGMLPKYVPPFAWGDEEPYDVFALPKLLDVAERQMARRGVPLDLARRRLLTKAHERGAEQRRQHPDLRRAGT
jgi:UDP-N-acetylglucosamine diphosphorylase/glucosamine-1-phosphate N-acetyltransferase